jgi:hypothetical protein
MKTSKILSQFGATVAALLLILVMQVGCVAVVDSTTPGAVSYVRGELQANVDRRFEVVERATNRAITELQFLSVEEKKDALVAVITARTAEDTRLHIKVERSTDKVSTIRIRAGTLGDEKLARIIFEKIKEAL